LSDFKIRYRDDFVVNDIIPTDKAVSHATGAFANAGISRKTHCPSHGLFGSYTSFPEHMCIVVPVDCPSVYHDSLLTAAATGKAVGFSNPSSRLQCVVIEH
jgi:hypothetical protein